MVSFASAWLVQDVLYIPYYDGERKTVVIDLKARTATGPEGTVQLDQLREFRIDHRSQDGDLKVHHFYTVHLSDGENRLVMEERAKDYYEFNREVAQEYENTLRAIHALPGLLGLPAEMAQPHLAPADPRKAYKTEAPRVPPAANPVLDAVLCGVLALGAFFLFRRHQSVLIDPA